MTKGQQALKLIKDEGLTVQEAAKRVGITDNAVYAERSKKKKALTPKKKPRGRAAKGACTRIDMGGWVAEIPTRKLRELVAELV